MKLSTIVAVAITLASSGLVSAAPVENRGASAASSHASHSTSKSSNGGGPFKTSSRNRYPAYGIGDGTGSFGGPMNLQGSGKDTPESSRVSGPHNKNHQSKGEKSNPTEHYSNADIKDQIPSMSELKDIGRQRFLSKMKQGMGLSPQQSASLLNIITSSSSTQGSHHSTKPTSSAHDRSIHTGVTQSSTAHSSESVKGHDKSNGKTMSLPDVDPDFSMKSLGKAHKNHKSKSNHNHSSKPSSSPTSHQTSSSASPSTYEKSNSNVKAAQDEPAHTAMTQSVAPTQGLQKRSMQKRRRCHKKTKSSHDSSSSSPSSSQSKSSHKSKHTKSSSPTSSSSSSSKSSPDNRAHDSSMSTTSTGPHGKVQSASSSSDINYVDDGSKSGSDVSGSGENDILRDFGFGRNAQQSNDESDDRGSGSSNNNNPFYVIPF